MCILVCETSYHIVEEPVPHCSQKLTESCYEGIGGQQCHNVSRTECKMVPQNVTKYSSPDVDVRNDLAL